MGGLILATAILATVGFLKAQTAANALAASVHSPSHVKNILLWCHAINAGRAYDQAFVRHVTDGKATYTLKLLPCQQIADRTAKAINH